MFGPFTTAPGIERLWGGIGAAARIVSPLHPYEPGSWGPDAAHDLIAPHVWRLPFERYLSTGTA
jgi:glucose-6-phosphate 1-dehydrogenase